MGPWQWVFVVLALACASAALLAGGCTWVVCSIMGIRPYAEFPMGRYQTAWGGAGFILSGMIFGVASAHAFMAMARNCAEWFMKPKKVES